MQIQVNTDNHINGSRELTERIEGTIRGALGRFGERITRVEVHLSDENSSAKTHDDDIRCVIEARLAGIQPITVTHQSASVEQAVDGACEKLEKTIKRNLERLDDPKGRTPTGGGKPF